MRPLVPALLALTACTATPASLDAPAHTVTTPAPFQMPATVLDADGEPIEDAAVNVVSVGDTDVVAHGEGGVLRCLKYGVSTVTLGSGSVQGTATVSCALIKSVQVSLPTTQVVLTRSPDGAPIPESLGTLTAAVIGLDDAPIPDLRPQLAIDDGAVLKRDGDTVSAAKPGLGRIRAIHGTHEAEHVVLVGDEAVRRAGIAVPAGDGVGLPLEAGRYTIWIGSDHPISVEARGAECESPEGVKHAVRCTFAATGSLRLEASSRLLGGKDAKATVRAVRWPMDGPEPSM
jgi:hypothetical protein